MTSAKDGAKTGRDGPAKPASADGKPEAGRKAPDARCDEAESDLAAVHDRAS